MNFIEALDWRHRPRPLLRQHKREPRSGALDDHASRFSALKRRASQIPLGNHIVHMPRATTGRAFRSAYEEALTASCPGAAVTCIEFFCHKPRRHSLHTAISTEWVEVLSAA